MQDAMLEPLREAAQAVSRQLASRRRGSTIAAC
jgi:hypothetical protein